MKKLVVLIGMVGSLMACKQSDTPEAVVLWADEFDTDGLPDPMRWTYHVGDGCPHHCGWGNHELQYYTSSRQENARVENGVLIIEAHKEPMDSSAYTSARLVTQPSGKWTYAYVEVRAKLPEGRGTWPAIWMLPAENAHGNWPKSGEIDIMEHVGYDPGVIHGTVHTQSFHHLIGTQKGAQKNVPTYSTEFHVYAINWTSEMVEFFIDGEKYHEFVNTGKNTDDWPFDQPFYLLLNLAVGGDWGGKMGVEEENWPRRMEVDYVRVYPPRPTHGHVEP